MRTAFVKKLIELAEKDKNIWLITGDLGYGVLDEFKEKFPDRFINAGIAEQNMMGVAAGLALSGKIVFVYSIANFPTFRCLEQIRNDVCYHNANVKIVSVGAGYSYGSHGYTHHGVEDIAIMRALPNMIATVPADPFEASKITELAVSKSGPMYIRLGKAGEQTIHSEPLDDLVLGEPLLCRNGTDTILFCMGNILKLAMDAADECQGKNKSVGVYSCPFIEPIDSEAILGIIKKASKVITIEEHGIGGLGSIISEIIAKNGISIPFYPIFLNKEIPILVGTQTQMRANKGLSKENICMKILAL
jgi:transketolase